MSELVIGLTIVAFGTSTPELVVNLYASFQGSADLAIGNVVGSNIFNILVILGISSLIYPLTVQTFTVLRNTIQPLGAIVLLIMANDFSLDGNAQDLISRADALVLLVSSPSSSITLSLLPDRSAKLGSYHHGKKHSEVF